MRSSVLTFFFFALLPKYHDAKTNISMNAKMAATKTFSEREG